MNDAHRARDVSSAPKRELVLKTLKYKEADEHLLRRLASALVLQWDQMPDELQDLVIDQAAIVEDRDPSPHTAVDIECFVRSVKVIAITKARSKAGV